MSQQHFARLLTVKKDNKKNKSNEKGEMIMKKRIISLLLIVCVVILGLTGCSSGEDSGSGKSSGKKVDLSQMKIGEMTSLVVNDGGWCQATHQSLLSAMKELGIPEKNLITIENVAEDQTSVQNAYNALVNDNVNLVIGASSGYAPFLSDLAKQNPDIMVAQNGVKADNLIGYQIKNYEGMFVAGYVSEMMSHSNLLGFAASMPESSVRAAANGYALGAKYANKDTKVQLIWNNTWYNVDTETQSAKTLINKGIKYMAMEASSPALPQTAESNGAYCIGYNVDMEKLAPKAVLTSFEWNFAPIFKKIIKTTSEGTASAKDYYYEGGECAKLADFNQNIVPKDIQQKAQQVKADIDSGKIKIYGGELKDNKGNVLVKAGKTMSDSDIMKQNFLVDNIIGEMK